MEGYIHETEMKGRIGTSAKKIKYVGLGIRREGKIG